MGSKVKRARKTETVNRELEKVFGPPSKEAEATLQKMRNWVARGLPKAADGAFLSSRVNW